MARGWLTCPVIGTGVEGDPYRAAVADREAAEGDRLEFVIGDGSPTCLVAFDVADPTNFAEHGGETLGSEEALEEPAGPASQQTNREVIEEIGEVITPTDIAFDPDAYLGEADAPPSGSFLEDTFTGTDGSVLTGHTGEKGATWTVSATKAELLANRVIASSTAYRYAYASGVPAGANYTVECGLWCRSAANLFTGPAGRISTSEDTSYQLGWQTNTGYSLLKRVAGVETVLGTYARVGKEGEEDVAVLSMAGTAIKGFVGGVERISATDSAISSAGKAGFRCQSTSGTRAHINYIIATDILSEVQATLAATYAIRGKASRELTALYGIRKLASAEMASRYAMRALVLRDITALYGLRSLAARELAATYDIQALVERELSATYGLREQVQAGLDATYTLRGLVGAELLGVYDIREQVEADLEASYALRGLAEADLQGLYAITQLVGADLVSLYAIRGQVARDLEATYGIRGRALAELVASYGIAGLTTAELVVLYSLLEPERHAASVELTVRPKTTASLTVRAKTAASITVRPKTTVALRVRPQK